VSGPITIPRRHGLPCFDHLAALLEACGRSLIRFGRSQIDPLPPIATGRACALAQLPNTNGYGSADNLALIFMFPSQKAGAEQLETLRFPHLEGQLARLRILTTAFSLLLSAGSFGGAARLGDLGPVQPQWRSARLIAGHRRNGPDPASGIRIGRVSGFRCEQTPVPIQHRENIIEA